MSNLTSDKLTFGDLPDGKYFIWSRSPELGPLRKCNARQALTDRDEPYRIASDEEVVV